MSSICMSSIHIGKIIITDKEIYGSREFNREIRSLGIIEYKVFNYISIEQGYI